MDLTPFDVDLIDYGRPGRGVLLSSGCGIGLAVMDACLEFRWFVDVDSYRRRPRDWEAIAIYLSVRKPSVIGFVGWFTIDTPIELQRFSRGVLKDVRFLTYVGGGESSLGEWIRQVNAF